MNIKPALATAAPHPLLLHPPPHHTHHPGTLHHSTIVNYLNELTGGHFQQAAAQMAHSSALAALAAQQQTNSPTDVDDVEHQFDQNDNESTHEQMSRKRLRSDATDESDAESSTKQESDDESAISEDADSEPARKKHNNGYSSDDLSSSKSQNTQG